jgi:shikimate dehydrogenase
MNYGLIGGSLSHSFSKTIHEELGNTDYKLVEITPSDFENFIKTKDFKGLNITIPYKQEVLKFCDNLSEQARLTHSVNTITKDENGRISGFNTDYDGFVYMLNRARISLHNRSVLIFGSGGTSKTASVVAEKNNAKIITLISRKGENNYSNLANFYDYDIIINTTPVGMYPNNIETLIDLSNFKNCKAVVDIIYNPRKSRLLLDAERLNIPHTNGLSMLVAQAKLANDIFMGIAQKNINIEEIYRKMDYKSTNLVLVGMPGSGKTTIGKRVAGLLNRPFFDTDEIIEGKTRMSISEIFAKNGEPSFRKIEQAIIEEIGKKTGSVIAIGGGGVLSEESKVNLRQNGFVVWLTREIDSLDIKNRPLSNSKEALHTMLEMRKKYYAACSDEIIYNENLSVEAVAKNISDAFIHREENI